MRWIGFIRSSLLKLQTFCGCSSNAHPVLVLQKLLGLVLKNMLWKDTYMKVVLWKLTESKQPRSGTGCHVVAAKRRYLRRVVREVFEGQKQRGFCGKNVSVFFKLMGKYHPRSNIEAPKTLRRVCCDVWQIFNKYLAQKTFQVLWFPKKILPSTT